MKVIVILLILFSVLIKIMANPPPYESWNVYAAIRLHPCPESVEVLCQTCAKITRSANVFPMCCTNDDEVRTWCQKAIDFGYETK